MKTKTKAGVKRKSQREAFPVKAKPAPRRPQRVVCLDRAGPSDFTCGVDEARALVVEESLDEREKRG